MDENKTCPLCGREMRLRTAKTGRYSGQQFWGCTGYSSGACKNIINLDAILM